MRSDSLGLVYCQKIVWQTVGGVHLIQTYFDLPADLKLAAPSLYSEDMDVRP
uniref:Uncharacterized protein n=1 Tax=Anguilla anguilla TaxID=7936 RepID=A0A0E9S6K9_ANGAN